MQDKEQASGPIAAVIAAAGQSKRMGQPKQLLPWGKQSVIEAVVHTLALAGVSPVVCIVGQQRDEIAQKLSSTSARVLHNPAYEKTDMLQSFQLGLAHLGLHYHDSATSAPIGALFSLGDQPHISVDVIEQILAQIQQTPQQIVIPSHQMRRGHPFYIPRSLWPDVAALGQESSLRTLLQRYTNLITYVNLESDAILADMDTPDDYAALIKRWNVV